MRALWTALAAAGLGGAGVVVTDEYPLVRVTFIVAALAVAFLAGALAATPERFK